MYGGLIVSILGKNDYILTVTRRLTAAWGELTKDVSYGESIASTVKSLI